MRQRTAPMRQRTILTASIAALALLGGACSRGGSTSSASSAHPTTTAAAAAGPGDFGTLKAVCGPGSAKGATEQGVTDSTIDVGTMSDPGAAAAPGLNQELFDTAKAFTTWCNNAGGINGRKLTLHLRDAKLFEVAARTVEACSQDFIEVGNGTAFDDSGVDQRLKCKLPEIPAYENSAKATESTLKVEPNPSPVQEEQVALYRAYQQHNPGAIKQGFLVGNLAPIVVTKDRFREAAEKVGLTTVYDETYPVTGIDNPQSYVQRMKDKGVEVLTEVGEPTALVALEKAMQAVGWYPKAIIESANLYDQLVIKNGADAVNNTWIVDNYYPFEAAGQNPATQQYLDIMKTDDPGGKIAALGRNAWDAWLLFATSARDCGATLTRDCVLQKAGAHPDWTAGGLKSPVSTAPATRHMTECYLALKASPQGFSIDASFLAPNKGLFNCDPANVVKLTGNYAPKS